MLQLIFRVCDIALILRCTLRFNVGRRVHSFLGLHEITDGMSTIHKQPQESNFKPREGGQISKNESSFVLEIQRWLRLWKFADLTRIKVRIVRLFVSILRYTILFLSLFYSLTSLFAEDAKQEQPHEQNENGYTINYNTVSIIEYVRFASKICNTNFIYNQEDLNFTVSVISDAPITAENVMGTLIQVLRINGLMLLEQDNNLVIHRSPGVKQIATLVTGKKGEGNAPIVTRIFRILNAKPESLAAIIRPMISSEALLEISPETRQLILTDITINVDKVASLIEILDSPHTPLEIKSYEVINNKIEFIIDIANQILAPLTQGNPLLLVPQPLANRVFIVSTPELVERAISILTTLDSPPQRELGSHKRIAPENILVYKIEYRSGSDILMGLNSIAENISKSGIPQGDLLDAIKTAHYIPQTNSMMFSGSPEALTKIKEVLASIDTPSKTTSPSDSFFVYKPQSKNSQEVKQAILEMANNMKKSQGANTSLVQTIDSVKVNPLTNTLTFFGEEQTFPRIQEMLATIDGKATIGTQKGNFFVYKIQHAPFSAIESSLKFFAANLDTSNTIDDGLIQSIHGMKHIEETNSILFTGADASLKKLQELIPSFDGTIDFPLVTNQLLIYKPKNLKEETFLSSIREVTDDLKKNRFTDPAFLQALQSLKWVKTSNSFLFTGDATSIKKVEDLLATIDKDSAGEGRNIKPNYFIYKLQHTSADVVEEDLDNLLKSFKSSGVKDPKLISAIENIRLIKETNSFLITGDPQAIEEVKQLLIDYDYPRAKTKSAQSNFLMYKPTHTTPAQMEKSLREVAMNLKRADLADPDLLAAVDSVKYIDATNSFLFTGTPESLQKLQTLIKEVDVTPLAKAPVQHIGKTSFLLYKLKNSNGTQVLASIKAMSADLKKSGASDKEFIGALQSAKYIRETNSILFTGPEESLQKVEAFASQFDVPSTSNIKPVEEEHTSTATNFFVYKPVTLSGPELEEITNDFADNLKISGLVDPDLFNAIHSMRWVEPSQSLIFTGSPKALDQIKQLIVSFDVTSNLPAGSIPTSTAEASIQGIDNTNFLVYKLQFHKGDEIQSALRQIAKDLITTGAPVNQNLLNSINSIQWIQITNSLLSSGDQETLSRLRDLIKSLDIPLKQVFIEMLVIETNLLNALEFGLEWGGKYKYRNKFQGSINNITPPATGGACVIPDAMSQLNNYIPTSPMPAFTNNIPFGCGFDLGIIGQVIKHNGQTFLSLGSLLSALQTDDETSVILTPKIITQDGRTSSIFVGSNVPFVGSFVNTNGNNTVQTSNIEYRDIGLNLTITPVLGNSDIVTLDISLDRSQTLTDLAGTALNFSNTSANGIITSKTTMQTTVHVPDKNFLILSGFVNNSNVKSTSGIPCLGGLPLIGAAFSKDNNTMNNQNIVIFLRPHVINSLDDLRRVTADQEDAFRDQQGTPFLMHQFDEGMELIKSIDDD